MESKKEITPFIECTNKEGKQFCNEGDRIICRTEDGRRYMGRVVTVCRYQESEETEPENVIYLNISQNGMSYSGEIIKVKDIASMGKVPSGDIFGYPITNEDLDRSNFINIFMGLGYVREKAEMMYGHMKEFISLYNIPLSVMLADVIQGADLNAGGKGEEELIDIGNRLLASVAGFFQTTTDKIKEARISGTDSETDESE